MNTNTLQIEKDIPVPAKSSGRETIAEFALVISRMQIGDSIAVPTLKEANRIYGRLKTLRRVGTMRKTSPVSWRVWRVR